MGLQRLREGRVMKVIRAIGALIGEVQAWRNRRVMPALTVTLGRTPYWGGLDLPVVVRNTGPLALRDCRYCRRQRFLMDPGGGSSSPAAEVWYATDAFDLPKDGPSRQVMAFATTDACPRVALSGSAPADAAASVEAA